MIILSLAVCCQIKIMFICPFMQPKSLPGLRNCSAVEISYLLSVHARLIYDEWRYCIPYMHISPHLPFFRLLITAPQILHLRRSCHPLLLESWGVCVELLLWSNQSVWSKILKRWTEALIDVSDASVKPKIMSSYCKQTLCRLLSKNVRVVAEVMIRDHP